MRNFVRHAMSSPALHGLFIAFTILAGLVVMAQGVMIAWQTLAAATVPDDVRIVDVEMTPMPSVTPALQVTNRATPVEKSTVIALEATSTLASRVPQSTVPVATPTTPPNITPLLKSDVPLFSWETDPDDPESAVVEVVDAQQALQRAQFPGFPTRIVIPSIRVDSPIVTVNLVTRVQRGKTITAWQVARNAVGFHNTSAPPGTEGNTVMSAHNNAWGRIFRNLINVKRGDLVELYVGTRLIQYEIVDKILVRQYRASIVQREENAAWIGPTADARLTLVSCWPYRRATHRVIVVARPTQRARQ
jgi:LPXTG-site transpeptidase (sortase) family protein